MSLLTHTQTHVCVQVATFEEPDYNLEQYKTSSRLAAQMLFTIQNAYGEIDGAVIGDFGCTVDSPLVDAPLPWSMAFDSVCDCHRWHWSAHNRGTCHGCSVRSTHHSSFFPLQPLSALVDNRVPCYRRTVSVDVDESALAIAKRNIEEYELEDDAELIHMNIDSDTLRGNTAGLCDALCAVVVANKYCCSCRCIGREGH